MSRNSSSPLDSESAHSESPLVGSRSIKAYGHGSSVPSSRVSGHEDHHRSDSITDLGITDEQRQQLQRGAESSPPSDSSSSRRFCPAPQHNTPRHGSTSQRDGERANRGEPKESGEESDNASGFKGKGVDTGSPAVSPKKASGKAGRLLIVANRLPLSMSIKRKTDDEKDVSQITFSNSSGGLVSALSGMDMDSRWIGWPGAEVRREEDRATVTKKLDELKCVPVFLTQKVADPFYNGYSNNLLWPLFHYIPLPVEAIMEADDQFIAYKAANQTFADAVLAAYEDGDIVWVHDYHLMLVPHMLRMKKPHMKIGFFFHTPFPAYEIYRMLPQRKELLDGVLYADLLGFHTHAYSRHFQKSCMKIVGAKGAYEKLIVGNFTAQLGTFPIGIDPTKFVRTLEQPAMPAIIAEYKREFKGRKVLLGIDRLDYIKGIQHKLYAFERLLEQHPELRSQVVLVQIAVPSRTDVEEYKKLRSSTHELVGRINGLYGGVGHAPIHYLDQSIPFDRMSAMYRVADAMVITSVRDGMNLVAYEYIACQQEQPGALILSEFAGAAHSLADAPIIVNPWNISELSDAMYQAITMAPAELARRQESMFKYVTTQTAQRWARDYIRNLLVATNTSLEWLGETPKDSPPTENGKTQPSAQVTPSNSVAVDLLHSVGAPSPVHKASLAKQGSVLDLKEHAAHAQ